MICTFRVLGLQRTVQTDASALVFSRLTGLRRIAWEDIEGAGVIDAASVPSPESFPPLVAPGIRFVNKLATGYARIWVAHRKGGRIHVAYLTVLRKDLEELAAEFRSRIGARWSDEASSVLTVRKQFGISNWWVPFGIVGFVSAILILFMALFFGFGLILFLLDFLLDRYYWFIVPLVILGFYGYAYLRSSARR